MFMRDMHVFITQMNGPNDRQPTDVYNTIQ